MSAILMWTQDSFSRKPIGQVHLGNDSKDVERKGVRVGEMKGLFEPKSVMVVGVADTPTNMGRNIVENLDRFHFKGGVYLVGKEGGRLNGRTICRSVTEVNGEPEVACFLIPAPSIPETLDECGQIGVRYAVIESGGFSEYWEANRILEDKILEIARKWDMRVVGPNCISILNLENGLVLPFMPVDPEFLFRGYVSVVSQSGGVIATLIRFSSGENIGFNKLLSIGNKLDLDECDYLEFLVSDPGTQVIGLYLEDFSDGSRLMNLCGSADKPIIVFKSNLSQTSHQAARFHTAALAGDDQVADAAIKQAGLHRVQNMQEMIDCFKIFSLPLMKGRNLAILSRSGGQAVISADAACRYGFNLPQFSDDTLQMVRQKSRAGIIRFSNPLDLGDIFDLDFYIKAMEQILKEKGVDGLIIKHDYRRAIDTASTQNLIRAARDMSFKQDKPVLVCLTPEYDEWFVMKHTTDFPIFSDPDQALKTLAVSYKHHMLQKAKRAKEGRIYASQGRSVLSRSGLSRPTKTMKVEETLNLLRTYHVPVVEYGIAVNIEEAFVKAKNLGYPVAVKVVSRKIIHKTDVKGVKLNITNGLELKRVFKEINGDECLIQKMAPEGLEVIVGGRKDREFGPVVLFGLGGIFVEVLQDVVLRVAPVDEDEAENMIGEIKGSLLLKGFRGQAPRDVGSLNRCIVNVSRLLVENPEIQNLDINPLIVMSEGLGSLVVDAKIEVNG